MLLGFSLLFCFVLKLATFSHNRPRGKVCAAFRCVFPDLNYTLLRISLITDTSFCFEWIILEKKSFLLKVIYTQLWKACQRLNNCNLSRERTWGRKRGHTASGVGWAPTVWPWRFIPQRQLLRPLSTRRSFPAFWTGDEWRCLSGFDGWPHADSGGQHFLGDIKRNHRSCLLWEKK